MQGTCPHCQLNYPTRLLRTREVMINGKWEPRGPRLCPLCAALVHIGPHATPDKGNPYMGPEARALWVEARKIAGNRWKPRPA
jgi:hypothetical protein